VRRPGTVREPRVGAARFLSAGCRQHGLARPDAGNVHRVRRSRSEHVYRLGRDDKGRAIPNGGSSPSSSITFRFTGSDNSAVAGFECSLDTGGFASCASPKAVSVARGKHVFQVRAIDDRGFRDETPAMFKWTR